MMTSLASSDVSGMFGDTCNNNPDTQQAAVLQLCRRREPSAMKRNHCTRAPLPAVAHSHQGHRQQKALQRTPRVMLVRCAGMGAQHARPGSTGNVACTGRAVQEAKARLALQGALGRQTTSGVQKICYKHWNAQLHPGTYNVPECHCHAWPSTVAHSVLRRA